MSHRSAPIRRPDHRGDFPREALAQSLMVRFEHILAKYAGRLAVKTATCTMTYGRLLEAANRVARVLRQVCDAPQQPVVILTGCDERLVLATLGVLKAG